MSLFKSPAAREAKASIGASNVWERMHAALRGGLGAVGVDAALTNSAVYECVDLIADLVSGFPVDRFRRDNEGVKVPVTNRTSLVENPSVDTDALNWRRIIVCCWLLRGFAAGLVPDVNRSNGFPTAIELVHPDRVGCSKVRKDAVPQWTLDNKEIDRWPLGPLWIAPGKMMNPGDPVGRSVLEFAAAEIGLGLAARKFGSEFFSDGAIPTGLIKGGDMHSEDAGKRIKARFLEAMGGKREPIVMGSDWSYEQIQVKPEESQFLDTVKANRAMIASYFKVPPELIGAPSGTGMTYTNVEHRGIDLMRFCVAPWVKRMEMTLTALTVRPEFVKLNVDELLRTDAMSRWNIYDKGIRAGVFSVNDVLELEDRKPIGPDGDRRVWPPWRMQLSAPELEGDVDSTEEGAPADA